MSIGKPLPLYYTGFKRLFLFAVRSFEEIGRLALSASKVLHTEMRTAVRAHTGELVRAMDGGGVARPVGQKAGLEDGDLDETMEDV